MGPSPASTASPGAKNLVSFLKNFLLFTLRLYYSRRTGSPFPLVAIVAPPRRSLPSLPASLREASAGGASAGTRGLAPASRLLPPEVEGVEAVDEGLGPLRARRPHLVGLLHELEEGLHLPLVGDGPGALGNLLPVLSVAKQGGEEAKGGGGSSSQCRRPSFDASREHRSARAWAWERAGGVGSGPTRPRGGSNVTRTHTCTSFHSRAVVMFSFSLRISISALVGSAGRSGKTEQRARESAGERSQKRGRARAGTEDLRPSVCVWRGKAYVVCRSGR